MGPVVCVPIERKGPSLGVCPSAEHSYVVYAEPSERPTMIALCVCQKCGDAFMIVTQ